MDTKIRQLLRGEDGRNFLAVMDSGNVRRAQLLFVENKESILLGEKIEIYEPVSRYPKPAPGQRWEFQNKYGEGPWAGTEPPFVIEISDVRADAVVDKCGSFWVLDRFSENGLDDSGDPGLRHERFLPLDQ